MKGTVVSEVFQKAKNYLNGSESRGRELFEKFGKYIEETHHALYIPVGDLLKILENEENHEKSY